MPALWEEEYEPDYLWLPKLLDCVDFENPAEITTSINTLFNSITLPTDFGDKTDFWLYLQNQYGEHRVMWRYTVQYPTPVHRVRRYNPDLTRLNKALYSIFVANDIKYKRLIASLNADYEPLKPYHIEEEHSEGTKYSKIFNKNANHEDTAKESAFDDLTLNPSSSINYAEHTDEVYHENNVSVNFDGNSFESNQSEATHKKDSRVGNIGNHSYAELIEKEIKLSRNMFWDIVCKDITDMVCLKMFYSFH